MKTALGRTSTRTHERCASCSIGSTPVLLCGHLHGGAVITEAAAGPHPAVRELVYLTAAVPGAGDSMVSLMSAATAQDADRPGRRSDDQKRRFGLTRPRRGPAARSLAIASPSGPRRLRRLRPMSSGRRPAGERGRLVAAAIHLRAREEDPMPEVVAPGFLEEPGGSRVPDRTLSELEPPPTWLPGCSRIGRGPRVPRRRSCRLSPARLLRQVVGSNRPPRLAKSRFEAGFPAAGRQSEIGSWGIGPTSTRRARSWAAAPGPGEGRDRRGGRERAVKRSSIVWVARRPSA